MVNKKNKAVILSLFLMATIVLSLAFVSANVITPASSATITGTAVLNASGANLVNCTFYAKSASTANSSWTNLGTYTNSSNGPGNPSINGTFASIGLEDSNDYIFNDTCTNESNSKISGAVTSSITVANTVPTTPSSLSPATDNKVTATGSQTFTCTVNDRTTTGCTIYLSKGGPYVAGTINGEYATMTYSSTSCSYSKTFNDFASNGDWYWHCTASDGTDTTSSADNVLKMEISTGGIIQTSGTKVTQKRDFPIIVVVIIIVLVIGGSLIVQKSSKRKR